MAAYIQPTAYPTQNGASCLRLLSSTPREEKGPYLTHARDFAQLLYHRTFPTHTPFPLPFALVLPCAPSESGGRVITRDLSCAHAPWQEFFRRINSKAIVVMLVVDTKPVILTRSLHNNHMDGVKGRLRNPAA